MHWSLIFPAQACIFSGKCLGWCWTETSDKVWLGSKQGPAEEVGMERKRERKKEKSFRLIEGKE